MIKPNRILFPFLHSRVACRLANRSEWTSTPGCAKSSSSGDCYIEKVGSKIHLSLRRNDLSLGLGQIDGSMKLPDPINGAFIKNRSYIKFKPFLVRLAYAVELK